VTAPEAGPTEVVGRLADRFDEDGLPYAVGLTQYAATSAISFISAEPV
jgi:hypothetical protein